jgi:hypothetical protein
MKNLTVPTVSTQQHTIERRTTQLQPPAQIYPQSSLEYNAATQSVDRPGSHVTGEAWRAEGQSDYPDTFGRHSHFPPLYFEDGNVDLFAELGGFDPDLAASIGG